MSSIINIHQMSLQTPFTHPLVCLMTAFCFLSCCCQCLKFHMLLQVNFFNCWTRCASCTEQSSVTGIDIPSYLPLPILEVHTKRFPAIPSSFQPTSTSCPRLVPIICLRFVLNWYLFCHWLMPGMQQLNLLGLIADR